MMVVLFSLTFLITCSFSSQHPLLSRNTYKGLRGTAVDPASTSGVKRFVYYHDQAVAVIDVNGENEIQDCDIIEVYEPAEAVEVLGNLSRAFRPTEVSFARMTSLMYQCQTFDRIRKNIFEDKNQSKNAIERANTFGVSAFNVFSGILPGTKWCGRGDIAEHYHDLGTDTDIDRCCRTHDLCPVKIRAQSSRYNLTNYSVYSKSHCDCDNALYNCLKSIGSSAATIMGKIFFNIIKVGCIEDLPTGSNIPRSSTGLTRRFAATKLYY